MLTRLVVIAVAIASAPTLAQCTKDTDCKGDRICIKGSCENPDKPAETTKLLEGVFLSLEQGDYSHWQMRTSAGKERSFFILRPDASLNSVLKAPEKFVGKKCRVKWRTSVQNIPESGGDMEMEEILSVQWL